MKHKHEWHFVGMILAEDRWVATVARWVCICGDLKDVETDKKVRKPKQGSKNG